MNKYAIIEASGRQFWVVPGEIIKLNALPVKAEQKIIIRRVLFGREEEKIFIGKPYMENIKIEATVKQSFLGPKIIVYKMKPKKKYRRKQGHRQQLIHLLINNITFFA